MCAGPEAGDLHLLGPRGQSQMTMSAVNIRMRIHCINYSLVLLFGNVAWGAILTGILSLQRVNLSSLPQRKRGYNTPFQTIEGEIILKYEISIKKLLI